MLIVRIQGGLGNQLNCYSFGRACAKELGVDLALDIEDYRSRRFENGEPYFRPYFLDKLNIKTPVVGEEVVYAPDFVYLSDTGAEFRGGVWEAIREQYRPGIGVQCMGGDWRFHESVIDELRQELNPLVPLEGKNKEIYEEILGCESVGIHFRFGDYITNPDCFVLPLTYYRDALQVVGRSVEHPRLFLFSDTPELVRRFKLDVPSTIIDWNDTGMAHNDLMLFSACRHKILANSSFSFWGARLEGRLRGTVLAPDTYFNPHGKRMKEQFGYNPKPSYPPEWRPLPVRISEEYQNMLDKRK
jgi:hypothetical protein